jgi:hypothetical protein
MENPDGVQSRIFIIVAIGLVGLLMIGLLSIAGLVVYTRFLAPAASPTTVAVASPSPTSVELATPTLPVAPGVTPTVGEVPTATRVVQPAASPAPGEETPTPVEGAPTATPVGGEGIPDTGFGPLEAVVGGVVLLVIILFVRRLRFTGQT